MSACVKCYSLTAENKVLEAKVLHFQNLESLHREMIDSILEAADEPSIRDKFCAELRRLGEMQKGQRP